jgi:putative addiction module CopG family antidote
MNLPLNPKAKKFIADRVKSGKYASPEAVVIAALHALERDERGGEFDAGEWDALLAEGEASGEALDGKSVLGELRDLRSHRPSKAG